MGPLAEIQRPSSFHPTALFLDGHRRPRLYRTCILSQSISLFKYPSELSAKPHWGEASGHFDPQIVRTNRFCRAEVCANACSADQAPCAGAGDARVCVMFLRAKIRHKDGKAHRAWSVVENRRVHDGRVVQRQVLYLGEINDSQRAAWSKAIEVFDEGAGQPKQIALFPEDRVAPALDCDVVSIRLSEMRLRRPRQWGACWMATVGSVAIGRVRVCGAAALARRDELAEHPEDVGRLPVDFSRQRMEIAQALVRA